MTKHQIDPDLLEEFFLDFKDSQETCENTLLDLEHNPNDKALLNALFRSIHTIKGNLVYVGLKDLTPLIQSIEDLLDAIRQGRLVYDSQLSDVILLSMDQTRQMVDAAIHGAAMPIDTPALDLLCQGISRIGEIDGEARAAQIQHTLLLLDPESRIAPAPIKTVTPPATKVAHRKVVTVIDEPSLLANYGIENDEDLLFFQEMARPLENRSLYWKARCTRMLALSLSMNQLAGSPVEPVQLAVAVYLHDLGMAFLPLAMLHKTTPYNEEERALLQRHPIQASDLLKSNRRWKQASRIILEHHERLNGTGYPQGLKEDEICPGAKILSIVDTFEARTHERAYATGLKRPLIRAILEINRCSGADFDPQWVDIFNEIIRTREPIQRQ
jgi:chemotaxis protein histidine kinase CheA